MARGLSAAPSARAATGRWRFARRRLLATVPVLLTALVMSFALIHVSPGDAVQAALAGSGGSVSGRQEAELRHQLGLDRPLPEQFLRFLADVARGDLGRSLVTGRPVSAMLADAAPSSLALTGCALVLAVLLGTATAVLSVVVRWSPARAFLDSVPVVVMSMPGYWAALLLVQLFSFRLGLFPAFGGGAAGLALPAVTTALPAIGVIGQILGEGLRSADRERYAATARAKGAGRARVLLFHLLPNAVSPSMTVLGTTVGNLLGASVVAETVFGRPGLGRLTVSAIAGHDYPVLHGVVLVLGITMVTVNLLTELVHARIDPRVLVDPVPR